MVQLRYLIDDEAARIGLSAIEGGTDDMTGLMDDIGRRLVTGVQMRFEHEVDPEGTPWRPSIRARQEGGQTLTDSGRLRDSISHQAGPREVAVGTNVIHAAIHQGGGTIRPKTKKALRFRLAGGAWVTARSVTIPARPFLGVDDGDRGAIDELVTGWLDELAAAGERP